MTQKRLDYYIEKWCNTARNIALKDCYKNPSKQKLKIWCRIVDEKCFRNGRNLTILTYNTHFFTCGYEWKTLDGRHFITIHTPSGRYDVDVTDK